MKSIYLILVTFFLLGGLSLSAKDVKVKNYSAKRVGNNLEVTFTVDVNDLDVARQAQLKLQPALVKPGHDTLKMSYLLFPGKKREMINERKAVLYGDEYAKLGIDGSDIYRVVNVHSTDESDVTYRTTVPFQEWMYGSRLVLLQDMYGCATCHKDLGPMALTTIAGEPRVSYVRPAPQPVEDIEVSLFLNFPFDQSVLLENFGQNRTELGKVHEAFNAARRYDNVEIVNVSLEGFASPEGRYKHNAELAQRRANTVRDYIVRTDRINPGILNVSSTPEDWDGLKSKLQSNAGIPNSDQLLRIIETVDNPDVRDQRIKQVDRGRSFRYLMENVYPELRRVDMTIVMETNSPATLQEIRQMVQSNPEQIRVNDIHMVANNYSPETEEFDEIFFYATQLYPEEETFSVNRAAAAIKKNDLQEARKALKDAPRSPEALNNMGVILQKEGKIDEAIQYYQRAKAAGSADAAYNLKNLGY